MAVPYFSATVPLTAASLNVLIQATGTSAVMPMFVPGENPAVKLNMLRDAAGLAATVPVFDPNSTAPIITQLNLFVDAINAAFNWYPGRGADQSAIIPGDTELLDATFVQVPAGQQMVTVAGRRRQLADFLSAPGSPGGGGLALGTTAGTAAAGNDNRITGAAQRSGLAVVAFTGNYPDLANKPVMPTLPALAAVALTGSYTDLLGKPTIPVLPTLAAVALSGSYADLLLKPVIPAAPGIATASTPGLTRGGGLGNVFINPDGSITAPVTIGPSTTTVGTTAGTVAAGDDARIVGAARAVDLTTLNTSLSVVAKTGQYNDLLGKPVILPPSSADTLAALLGLNIVQLATLKVFLGITPVASGTPLLGADGAPLLGLDGAPLLAPTPVPVAAAGLTGPDGFALTGPDGLILTPPA